MIQLWIKLTGEIRALIPTGLAALALCLSGFASQSPAVAKSGSFKIDLTSYVNRDTDPFVIDGKIHVYTGETPDLQKAEIANKIEYLLRQLGYAIVDTAEADYVLHFDYGIGSHTEAYTKYVHDPSVEMKNSGKGFWAGFADGLSYSVRSQQPIESLRNVNDRYFSAHLVDIEKSKDSNTIVYSWQCNSSSSGELGDLRYVLNYLLVPAFQHFAEDTGRTKSLILREGDSEVSQLISKFHPDQPILPVAIHRRTQSKVWYTYWGGSSSSPSFGQEVDEDLSIVKNVPGVGYIPLGFDLLGVYLVSPDGRYLRGIIVNGFIDDYSLDKSLWFRVTAYTFGASVIKFLNPQIGRGPFIRIDAGPARLTVDASFFSTPVRSDWGAGGLIGAGYALPIGSKISVLVSANYAYRWIEEDAVENWTFSLGTLF